MFSPEERERIRVTALQQLRVLGASRGVTEAWIDQTLWVKSLTKQDRRFLAVNSISAD